MASTISKKRKHHNELPSKSPSQKVKRRRRQREYHSSTEDEDDVSVPADFAAINLQGSDSEVQKGPEADLENDDSDSASDGEASQPSASGSNAASTKQKRKSKRNDPAAFSTSIAKILSTKLPASSRSDPVLSRSKNFVDTTSAIANERLEQKAKSKLRAERVAELERGRVKDVLGIESGEAGETAELEKKLRRIAQRGVVKLFNAVRAAQVKGEEAAKEERKKGTVGLAQREGKVNEVSKQSFLELINGKGKGGFGRIEEA
jgi:hypothetical protein